VIVIEVVRARVVGQPLTTEMLVVFGIILFAFLLFITEPVPADITALVVIVSLIVLGVVAMVATGCLKPAEVHEGVDWSVIFLLAGVISLRIALEHTGGATFLAGSILALAGNASPIVVLGLFYLATALITELVSDNASVVLMIPVGVDAAARIGADPLAFVLAVTLAASTSTLGPIGLPDESDGLRPRRLQVHGLLPGRCATPGDPRRRDDARDRRDMGCERLTTGYLSAFLVGQIYDESGFEER
jgi:di/tricarboxylate transporter